MEIKDVVDGLEVHIVAEKIGILDFGMWSDRKRLLRIRMKYSYGFQKVKFIPLEKPTHHRADDIANDLQEKQDLLTFSVTYISCQRMG